MRSGRSVRYQRTGLKLLGQGYCDPSTGPFLTRDPIKDGRNWYAYGAGGAAPTNIVGPTGLWTFLIPVAKYGAWFVGAILAGFTAGKFAEDLSSLHNSLRNVVGLRESKSLFASAGAPSFKVLDALRNDQNEVAVQEGRNLIRRPEPTMAWWSGYAPGAKDLLTRMRQTLMNRQKMLKGRTSSSKAFPTLL